MKKILITAAAFAFMSFNVFAEEKIGDQIVSVEDSDKAMNAAIEKARGTLDDFFEVSNNPPQNAEGFKLKVKFTDDYGTEHLWFAPFREEGDGYVGVLVNEPSLIRSMTYGEVYAFKRSAITDWGYVQNGEQIGSYTICALFLTMPVETVNQYKDDYGFVCDS